MTIRKIAKKLHLWLGLISGLIVCILCLTGAIWALTINGWVGDEEKTLVEAPANAEMLPPSELAERSRESLQGHDPTYVSYETGEATYLGTFGKGYRIYLTLNPYTGDILKTQDIYGNTSSQDFDFFRFIGRGHRSLWLPMNIGRPIVNYATLVFVFVLISGFIIWIPKTKKALKNRLWFKWTRRTGNTRKIVDLHSVAGFYVAALLFILSLTGMVWGIEWYSKGLYKITTGGKELPGRRNIAQSDPSTADLSKDPMVAMDMVFQKLRTQYPQATRIQMNFPDKTDSLSVIRTTVYPEKRKFYNGDGFIFDRYTLKEIQSEDPFGGRYKDAGFGDKLRRMNYDLHTGAIGGTPGRILIFIAALIGASLPFTGLYIYTKSKRKKSKKQPEILNK